MQRFICLLVMTSISFSAVLGKSAFSLKVTWGPDQTNPNYFVDLPTTVRSAIKQGFKKISECDNTTKWRGARYVKDNDYSLVLLFDITGFVAGIQTTVPRSGKYPSAKIQPPFVEDGDRWATSAYFVEPGRICTKGRTQKEFNSEERKLYIQKTASPEASVLIPDQQKNLKGTKWTEGKCFPTMGKHFWCNLRKDKPCDEMYPAFLLYNKGQLTAFGWNLLTNLPSKRYEHPQPNNYGMFMEPVPDCLKNAGTISTMHIYFTRDIKSITC